MIISLSVLSRHSMPFDTVWDFHPQVVTPAGHTKIARANKTPATFVNNQDYLDQLRNQIFP